MGCFGHRLFPGVRLLPSAFCLLPSAFCLLPSAFCLLPSAFVIHHSSSEFRRLEEELGLADADLYEALEINPALGWSDSPLNNRFLLMYETLRAIRSARLDQPDWPEKLADECAAQPRTAPGPLWGRMAAKNFSIFTGRVKGFYAVSFVLSLFAAIAVQKNIRDVAPPSGLENRPEGDAAP